MSYNSLRRRHEEGVYPKVYRLPLHKYNSTRNLEPPWEQLPGKFYMTKEQAALLLDPGLKYIREKMNGSTHSFRMKHYLVHYENVRKRRVIPYTNLPSYQFVFAVENTVTGKKLNVQETIELCVEYNWYMPHIITITKAPLSIEELVSIARRPSHYNPEHMPEGILIINENIEMEGKIVNPEYDDNKQPGIYQDLEYYACLEDNYLG